MDPASLAEAVGVDHKTAERWLSKGRTPRRRTALEVAALLKEDPAYLWPALVDDARQDSASRAEFVTLYPHRGAVPLNLWASLLDQAKDCVDVLVYAGLFLTDGTPDLAKRLIHKAENGVRVRVLLGDPDSEAVAARGAEEGVFGGVSARIKLSLTHLQDAIGAPGVHIHLHSTTLYSSIYRFDDVLLANTHVFGAPAAQSPVVHVQRIPGGRLFDHYMSSFDRVYSGSVPVEGSVVHRG
ncbi:XRE family transcriptional regulator [Frankia sp. AvcI1]|uniref:XRE family transcriptional regulator n=2 Tax=Frankiaceae TaxID=74712 RepID=UPI00032391B8|nr:XRE family transcriptional regulator [Frankia sp. AvcI1]